MSDTEVKVAIIGAGAVGSTFAYTLMHSGLAREIVLIDADRDRARSKALDMNHGLLYADPVNVWAGPHTDCGGADVVVVTPAGTHRPGQSRKDLIESNAAECRRAMDAVRARAPDTVVVIAISPVDALTYDAIRHSGLPARQVMGTGTVLDSARLRFMLAKHCCVDARDVRAYALGRHGEGEVAAWSAAGIGGLPLEEACAACGRGGCPDERRRIVERMRNSAYHVIEAEGTACCGISQALLRIVRAVVCDERRVLTVSSLLDDCMGVADVCLSVPCVVGRQGIVQQFGVELNDEEANQFRAGAAGTKAVQDSLVQ